MVRPVIGALALALALAGCGGDPKADPTPTPSAPVTTPVSTTPAPPVMPEAAKANTKAGAIAFVRYYIELINHLQATGDEAPLVTVSREDCRSCESVVRAANAIYDAGGHLEGGSWKVNEAVATHPAPAVWTVQIDGQLAPSRVFAANSSTAQPGTGGRANAEFVVTFNRSWEVVQWETN